MWTWIKDLKCGLLELAFWEKCGKDSYLLATCLSYFKRKSMCVKESTHGCACANMAAVAQNKPELYSVTFARYLCLWLLIAYPDCKSKLSLQSRTVIVGSPFCNDSDLLEDITDSACNYKRGGNVCQSLLFCRNHSMGDRNGCVFLQCSCRILKKILSL